MRKVTFEELEALLTVPSGQTGQPELTLDLITSREAFAEAWATSVEKTPLYKEYGEHVNAPIRAGLGPQARPAPRRTRGCACRRPAAGVPHGHHRH